MVFEKKLLGFEKKLSAYMEFYHTYALLQTLFFNYKHRAQPTRIRANARARGEHIAGVQRPASRYPAQVEVSAEPVRIHTAGRQPIIL